METSNQNVVLVISSHVVRGSVGNRASVFALETLGHRVWALPTVILPFHPGHGPSSRIAIADADFAQATQELADSAWTGELSSVLTGFFASPEQVCASARLISRLQAQNPDLVYLCDPVIGDESGLYVSADVAKAIRDELLPLASIATPNRFELAWFAGVDLVTNHQLAEAALKLGPPKILVTSAVALMAASTGNLWVTRDCAILAEHRLVARPPNGPGDLLAAIFLSRLLAGETEEQALEKATASVFEVLARTAKQGLDELALSENASSLATPMAMVQMRKLMHPLKT